jgi:putative transcriptional regulator
MNAFESIKQGLEDAKAFSKGRGPNAIVHELAVPDIDVSEIRARTGLSQAEFARSIGVAKKRCSTGNMDGALPTGQPRCCWL